MRDYIELGSAPSMEPCAQVGSENYTRNARVECRVYKDQLTRTFPNVDPSIFQIRSFSHDFGRYFELVVSYDDSDELSVSQAFEIDNNCPEYWDDEAKALLAEMLKS